MMNKSKREVREMLIKKANRATPDLWDKIEPQLQSRPAPKTTYCEKHSHKPIYRYAVASFAILLAAAVVIVSIRTPKTIVITSSSKASFSSANPSASSLPSSVLFSSLHFPASSNQLTLSEDPSATMCLAPFSEKDVITHSEIICRATVTNSYVKDYKYVTYYSDKFERRGQMHQSLKSIVYEIIIDDMYYNKKAVKVGDTIKVEESMSFGTLAAVLQQNHQYILNLYDNGEKAIVYNYASGNINRDGRYDFCYAFVPQIEVTLDQQYLFHDGWKSLINNKTIDVIYDKDAPFQQQDTFYQDKMKLRQDKDFISDYKKMIAKYK